MTSCWVCAYPSPGLTSASGSISLGVCTSCSCLACDLHGAVDTAKGQYWCSVCLPSLVIRGGTGGDDGGGGGPSAATAATDPNRSLLADPVQYPLSLALRFPELVARGREHAEPVRPVAAVVLRLAQLRWRRLAGEDLDVPLDLVPTLVGVSLWSAGHAPGDLPSYPPGEEGRQLRRNPLVAGLLYGQQLDSTRGFFGDTLLAEQPPKVWAEPEFAQTPQGQAVDAEVHDELALEVRRMQRPDGRRPERTTVVDARPEDLGQTWLTS